MKIHGGTDAPRKLGEYLLTLIAGGRAMQALHVVLSQLREPLTFHPTALEDLLGSGTRLPKINGYCMPSGDLLLFAQEFTSEALRQLKALLTANARTSTDPEAIGSVCSMYDIPDDAVPLRQLVKSYLVSGAANDRSPRQAKPSQRAARRENRTDDASEAPLAIVPTASLTGPLTLDSLDQLNALIGTIDVASFIDRQPIYRRDGEHWAVDYMEYYFNLERLRHSYFPNIDLHANEALFCEFIRNLDDLMLFHLLKERKSKSETIAVNLSINTARSPFFEKFSNHLSRKERQNIICELHWIDVLQDIQEGGSAVRCLTDGDYGIAMDRISLQLLPYLNLADIRFDFIKIRFDRDSLRAFDEAIVLSLRGAQKDKVVFSACDDRRAIALGETLGVARYQGRLIDDMLQKAA